MYSIILIALLSYLIGSFPTSVVFGRMTRRIDIRDFGSKNAGGTNAFRVLGWQAGLIVAIVDVLKGMMAVLLVGKIRIDPLLLDFELIQIMAGSCAVIGHIWTVLAKFKGGKGVATAAGMLIAIYPWAALVCFSIFVIVVLTTRYVSVGSMTAVSSLPVILLIFNRFMGKHIISYSFIVFTLLISGLIFFTHRENIRRLIEGTENRFNKLSFKKKA